MIVATVASVITKFIAFCASIFKWLEMHYLWEWFYGNALEIHFSRASTDNVSISISISIFIMIPTTSLLLPA